MSVCLDRPKPIPSLYILILSLSPQINPRDILEPDTSKRCPHREQHDDEHCWCGYPQSLYPNWTIIQQRASRIREALRDSQKWTLYPLVVSKEGMFKILEDNPGQCGTVANFWESFRLPEVCTQITIILCKDSFSDRKRRRTVMFMLSL